MCAATTLPQHSYKLSDATDSAAVADFCVGQLGVKSATLLTIAALPALMMAACTLVFFL